MLLLHLLAEQRIEEAMRQGHFDHLPGAGRPLDLDDDRMVPEESRLAYRLLKNAGFVPPELEMRKEIADLHRLLATVTDAEEQQRAQRRLALLQAMLEANGRGGLLRRDGAYRARLLARLSSK
ncbi:MAG TPA: DnaJ family domain-containing protein [Casimicrobiaceae bacterium]|nr:DnaJ family domain-containing protein [Casimicrobiaceae bacterium]